MKINMDPSSRITEIENGNWHIENLGEIIAMFYRYTIMYTYFYGNQYQ